MTEHNSHGQYFSIIPHWIIFSGVSSGAIHLYAVLAKYADYDTHEAFPSRKTLAKGIGKSVDTVDRHVKELTDLGALEVTKRKRPGSKEHQTSVYQLIYAEPAQDEVAAPVRPRDEETVERSAPVRPPVAATMPPGSRTDTAENETHLTKPIPPKNTQTGFLLAFENSVVEEVEDEEKMKQKLSAARQPTPPPADVKKDLDKMYGRAS